jgi:hypothetical protein
VSLLPCIDANDLLWDATLNRNTHYTLMTLSEIDCIARPLDSKRHLGIANREGGATRYGYTLNRPITACVEGNPPAVRREYRIGDALVALCTTNRPSRKVGHRTQVQPVIRNIDQVLVVRRKGHGF